MSYWNYGFGHYLYLGALARNECVESRDVARLALADLLAVPVVLSLLAAFALPRKQDD